MYLDINNYNHTRKNHRELLRLTHSIQKVISVPSQYAYINHSANMHHNVPLWVATNALTFGQISKMYQYATTDIRTKISKNFQNVSEKQLHQFINIIGKCRNVCAHGERLFSFRINETIPDTLLHKKLQIPQNNNHYVYGKQDLFAVVISLLNIQPPSYEDGLIFLPSYNFIYKLLLFTGGTTEINACCFDALMSHKVSKQSNIIVLFKEVLCVSVTE